MTSPIDEQKALLFRSEMMESYTHSRHNGHRYKKRMESLQGMLRIHQRLMNTILSMEKLSAEDDEFCHEQCVLLAAAAMEFAIELLDGDNK